MAQDEAALHAALKGRSILVIEDETLIALDLAELLEFAGAKVLGPVATVLSATAVIEATLAIDGAILDLNLRGERSVPVAYRLKAKNVPFIFVTAYGRREIPDDLRDAPVIGKPCQGSRVLHVLAEMMLRD
jgi:DNA-binding response OmpR family regulator